jgi:hypothetical protein
MAQSVKKFHIFHWTRRIIFVVKNRHCNQTWAELIRNFIPYFLWANLTHEHNISSTQNGNYSEEFKMKLQICHKNFPSMSYTAHYTDLLMSQL